MKIYQSLFSSINRCQSRSNRCLNKSFLNSFRSYFLAPCYRTTGNDPSKWFRFPISTRSTDLPLKIFGHYPTGRPSINMSASEYFKFLYYQISACKQLLEKDIDSVVKNWKYARTVVSEIAEESSEKDNILKNTDFYQIESHELKDAEIEALHIFANKQKSAIEQYIQRIQQKMKGVRPHAKKRLWQSEINLLKKKDESFVRAYLLEKGIVLDEAVQNLKKANSNRETSIESVIESLGISDSKTLIDHVHDYDALMDFASSFSHVCDVASFQKRYNDFKQTDLFKSILSSIDEAENSNEAIEKMNAALNPLGDIISELSIEIIQSAKPCQNITIDNQRYFYQFSKIEAKHKSLDVRDYLNFSKILKNPTEYWRLFKIFASVWFAGIVVFLAQLKMRSIKMAEKYGVKSVGHRSVWRHK